jgi:hypothetical protein
MGMRILTLDIETSPNLAHVWDIWKGMVSPKQVIKQWDMMMFAGHWTGSDEPPFAYTEFHDGREQMIAAAWTLLDQADALLTYNGKRFDKPRLNTVLALANYQPPSPFEDIDLDETIRREFDFPSHSLDFVLKAFGSPGKIDTGGYELWRRCLEGDKDAWDKMREYCIGDVMKTEWLYFRVLPWIKRHPSFAVHDGMEVCINCGSDALIKKGFGYTLGRVYQRMRCTDCGKPQRSAKAEPGSSASVVELR